MNHLGLFMLIPKGVAMEESNEDKGRIVNCLESVLEMCSNTEPMVKDEDFLSSDV